MDEAKYKVELTYDEVILLDGRVSESAQKIVEAAKLEHSINFELPLINTLIRKSVENGEFTYTSDHMRYCSICKQSGDYIRYKSGPRKGRKNLNKPTFLSGFKFFPGFIRISGTGEICRECEIKHQVIKSVTDYILEHDLPVQLRDKENNKWKKDKIQICFKCGEEMQESKMGRVEAIMGGTYPGICPHCGAKALLFGASHKSTNKWVMERIK